MDLTHPIGAVIPSAHGAVLAVLARTHEPLSGRRVAELTVGRVGQRQTNEVLGQLVAEGIVVCQSRPPAKLYTLNRNHVAAPAVQMLADLWGTLLERIRGDIARWETKPTAAVLFGSAARGEASGDSDIDILLVWKDPTEDDPTRSLRVEQLAENVLSWSGNQCEILELTQTELADAVQRDDRLVHDLRTDALALAGTDVRTLIRKAMPR